MYLKLWYIGYLMLELISCLFVIFYSFVDKPHVEIVSFMVLAIYMHMLAKDKKEEIDKEDGQWS